MPEKLVRVAGRSRSELAKIGGITPAVLSLRGMCELSPCVIRLPCCRFGYWMMIRRCARSMKTTNTTTPTAISMNMMIMTAESEPCRPISNSWPTAAGPVATMPAKMMSEMPLPTPRAVTCSPSHIRKIVPPTRVMTVEARKNRPGFATAAPAELCAPSSPTAMP